MIMDWSMSIGIITIMIGLLLRKISIFAKNICYVQGFYEVL